jgi:hypothetical protein
MSYINETKELDNIKTDIDTGTGTDGDIYCDLETLCKTEAFNNGINILDYCGNCMEQTGAGTDGPNIVERIFDPNIKSTLTRFIKGASRTSLGIGADVLPGGDIITNSLFAVNSTNNFIKNIIDLLNIFTETKFLFHSLIVIHPNNKIPFSSKLKFDDGFVSFETEFEKILAKHVYKYGMKGLEKFHDGVIKILNKITTTVSDWIGCLFPDTAGLASEISKNILDHVSKNGFKFIYNLIDFLPDNMQECITNSYALKILIHNAVHYLREIIRTLSPSKMAELVSIIGDKAGNYFNNFVAKSAITIGTSLTKIGLHSSQISYNMSSIPYVQKIIVKVIDKYISPNINTGVDLFNQLFPLFMAFSSFLQKFPLLKQLSSDQSFHQLKSLQKYSVIRKTIESDNTKK